jgi:hypothetical protein
VRTVALQQAERVAHGPFRQLVDHLRVVRETELIHVVVERGTARDLADAVAVRGGDDRRQSGRCPAVRGADDDGPPTAHPHGDRSVPVARVPEQDGRPGQRVPVRRRTADDGNPGAGDGVDAADDLLLVAGQAVCQQEDARPVALRGDASGRERGQRRPRRPCDAAARVGGVGTDVVDEGDADLHVRTGEHEDADVRRGADEPAVDDDAAAGGTDDGDAGSAACGALRSAPRNGCVHGVGDRCRQRGQVMGVRGEDDHQGGRQIADVSQRRRSRLVSGGGGRRLPAEPDSRAHWRPFLPDPLVLRIAKWSA